MITVTGLTKDYRTEDGKWHRVLSDVSFATVVVTCLLAYGIAWLLIASVREHASA